MTVEVWLPHPDPFVADSPTKAAKMLGAALFPHQKPSYSEGLREEIEASGQWPGDVSVLSTWTPCLEVGQLSSRVLWDHVEHWLNPNHPFPWLFPILPSLDHTFSSSDPSCKSRLQQSPSQSIYIKVILTMSSRYLFLFYFFLNSSSFNKQKLWLFLASSLNWVRTKMKNVSFIQACRLKSFEENQQAETHTTLKLFLWVK